MKNQIIKEHLKNFDMNLLFKRKTAVGHLKGVTEGVLLLHFLSAIKKGAWHIFLVHFNEPKSEHCPCFV